MGDHDIVVEIYRRGKFVDGVELEYVRGGVSEIKPINIDKLSRFEIIRLAKDVGVTNVEEFWYLTLAIGLGECLMTCHNGFQSLDMVAATTIWRRLVVYLVHEEWEVPRPKSPIQWDELMGGDSLTKVSSDNEYSLEIELDLEAFEHGLDTNVDDDCETNVKDEETTDEDYTTAKAKVVECKI
ncbi:hypothetical protein Cgig2_030949 [Carnegiea gigantea]|uniref:PB1-like domain-containing protein n=1 Tax=Carnegiea gigantea TaxID=171969 RepID=A0A9Q1GX46_9CARY|nr:hypothetical protein Cgig2_030949 [Carnegiea gigantea]